MAKIIKFPGGSPEQPENERNEEEKADLKILFRQALTFQTLAEDYKKHGIKKAQFAELAKFRQETASLTDQQIVDKVNAFVESEFESNPTFYLALREEYEKRKLNRYEQPAPEHGPELE